MISTTNPVAVLGLDGLGTGAPVSRMVSPTISVGAALSGSGRPARH